MVDVEQRGYAAEIVAGSTDVLSQAEVSDKAILYGLFALVMSDVDLSQIRSSMLRGDDDRYADVHRKGLLVFMGQVEDALAVDPELQQDLNAKLLDSSIAPDCSVSLNPTMQRLHAGVATMLDAESIVINTVRKRFEDGERVTREGLYNSQRVLFRLALINILRQENVLRSITEISEFRNGEILTVLTDYSAAFEPNKGLELKGVVEQPIARTSISPEYWSRFGPNIGCPVTLLKGFVRSNHQIFCDATLRAGLIEVA